MDAFARTQKKFSCANADVGNIAERRKPGHEPLQSLVAAAYAFVEIFETVPGKGRIIAHDDQLSPKRVVVSQRTPCLADGSRTRKTMHKRHIHHDGC